MSEIASYSVVEFVAPAMPEQFINVVLARWLRSLRFGNKLFKQIDRDHYFTAYEAFVKRLISHPDIKIRFAVLSDDPDNVLGWCVYRENLLIYVHVQELMRRNGIATSLVPPDIDCFMHKTDMIDKVWERYKYNKLKYKPFINPLE